MNLEVRVLTEKDAEAFWWLRLEGLESDPFSFAQSAEEHRATTPDRITPRFAPDASQSNFVVGAFCGAELVGMAGFAQNRHAKTRHRGQVWGVYERARSIPDLEYIDLHVGAETVAKKLYSSLGFETIGLEARALKVDSNYVDQNFMALRIQPRDPA